MNDDDLRTRFFLVAEKRLANRPGASKQLRLAVNTSIKGAAVLFGAMACIPAGLRFAAEAGNQEAVARIDEVLTVAIDEWAERTQAGVVRTAPLTPDSIPANPAARLGWHIAMIEAWPEMLRIYGRRPSEIEAVKYLRKNDTSGEILDCGGAGELWWKTKKGVKKEVSIGTVRNYIRRTFPK